ncbi:protein kinase domain-containing protein [Alkaliphilus transvaalensis]|uniref:protein kinase domain-containing protein n=1 Tax=Alkaliphilus transvaalensis TaxID=114628 RepID=UPI00047A56F1|nr:protein kinase [Alkaliphilus transvaalensis]
MQEALGISEVVTGKWNKNQYRILKRLGAGGTAEVFLVEREKDKQTFAMKVSQDNLSLNREYQLLRKFHFIEFVVNVHEMDDFHIGNEVFHYLLLDYIDGDDLKSYVEKVKLKMITILGIILIILKGLEEFHRAGYILGDLKLENIMFDREKKQIKLIDLGGVVEKTGTIKEYTPAYDRATWKCGTRKAEESYDLFTLTMILVKLAVGENLNPHKERKEDVFFKVQASDLREELKKLIIDMMKTQQYSRREFAKEINELYNKEKHSLIEQRLLKRDSIINNLFKVSLGLLILTTCFLLVTKGLS